MEADKIFASVTGLRPFSLIRGSCTLAITIATLVTAKFIDIYLFCGFNPNSYIDLLIGVALFAGCCVITPLLELAIKRKVVTKYGGCWEVFCVILIEEVVLAYVVSMLCASIFPLFALSPSWNDEDPFNVCGNRNYQAVKAQFSNAMPTFELVQHIDAVFKVVIAIGWLLPIGFILALCDCFLYGLPTVHNQPDLEAGNLGGNGDSAATEPETVREIGDQPATIDIDDDESAPGDAIREAEEERSSEVGSVDVEIENRRNESNEPGSDAKSQLKEAE